MKLTISGLFFGSMLMGCSALPSAPAVPKAATPGEASTSHPALHATASLAVLKLSSDPSTAGRVLGDLSLEGPLAVGNSLRFEPTHSMRLEVLSARDHRGPVDLKTTSAGSATLLEVGHHDEGPLEIHYALTIGAAADALAPIAEAIELRGTGDDLLVLPDLAEPIAVEIQLHTGGGNARAASSFGLGNDVHVTARPDELRAGYYMAGDVGSAAFHTTGGDDFAGFIGFTSFDPRWVSAETAGVRSAVDDYMDRAPGNGAPPISLLFSSTKRSDPPLLIIRRARGLLVSADPGALWSAPSRIRVAQALAQRYVGGVLWVGDRKDEASGYFFSEGFSRAVATRVLFDLGTLDHGDRAAELNTLLSEIDLSPLGKASLSDLARTKTPEAVAVQTARGALIATAIDVELRRKPEGNKSLRTLVRGLLETAKHEKADALSFADFMGAVRSAVGEARGNEIQASLRDGTEIALPRDLIGPCYRLERKDVAPFELGFVVRGTSSLSIESVKAGSRAEAAGLQTGDVVRDVRYQDGRSDVAVTVVVVHEGHAKNLHFLPQGPAKPGRAFVRARGVDDDHC